MLAGGNLVLVALWVFAWRGFLGFVFLLGLSTLCLLQMKSFLMELTPRWDQTPGTALGNPPLPHLGVGCAPQTFGVVRPRERQSHSWKSFHPESASTGLEGKTPRWRDENLGTTGIQRWENSWENSWENLVCCCKKSPVLGAN